MCEPAHGLAEFYNWLCGKDCEVPEATSSLASGHGVPTVRAGRASETSECRRARWGEPNVRARNAASLKRKARCKKH
jgi:hypothetical protein